MLQQIHYLLREPEFGRRVEGHKWIFNTVEEWKCRYFPFWSERTIRTIFSNLARLNLVTTIQPEGRISRRKYYRINMEALEKISDSANIVTSIRQKSSLPRNGQNSSLPQDKEETTEAKTTEVPFRSEKGTAVLNASHLEARTAAARRPAPVPADPKQRRRERNQLREPRFPYPRSEHEMYETLEEHGVEWSEDYDGRFFDTMQENEWMIAGRPIYDWISTYAARLQKTTPGLNRR